MTVGSLLLFVFVLYLLYIVTNSVINNYKADKEIDKQSLKLIELEEEIILLENQINYYKTNSFKEKEAREKLGYKAPGESVVSLPLDTVEEKVVDNGVIEDKKIEIPNYRLWWEYFFNNAK